MRWLLIGRADGTALQHPMRIRRKLPVLAFSLTSR